MRKIYARAKEQNFKDINEFKSREIVRIFWTETKNKKAGKDTANN